MPSMLKRISQSSCVGCLLAISLLCGFAQNPQWNRGREPHNYARIEGDDATPAERVFPGVYASVMVETVYFVECGARAALIDTGWDHTFEKHLARFAKAGLDLNRIDAVLATHSHVDHLAGARRARTTRGYPIIAHRNAVVVKQSGDRVATAALIPALGWDANDPEVTIDVAVDEGDTIEVGGAVFRVHHLPGHTPDSVGYQLEQLLFTGDLFGPRANLKMFWPGWADIHWGSNSADLLESFEKIGVIAPAQCLPSHGRPFAYDPFFLENGLRRLREGVELFYGAVNVTSRALRRDARLPVKNHRIPLRTSAALPEPVARLGSAFSFSLPGVLGLVRPEGDRAGVELIPLESRSLLGESGYLLRLGDVLHEDSERPTGLIHSLNSAVASIDASSLTIRFRRSIAPAPLAAVTYALTGADLDVLLAYSAAPGDESGKIFVLESLLPADGRIETLQERSWKPLQRTPASTSIRCRQLRISRPGSRLLLQFSSESEIGCEVSPVPAGRLLRLRMPGAREGNEPSFRAQLRVRAEGH